MVQILNRALYQQMFRQQNSQDSPYKILEKIKNSSSTISFQNALRPFQVQNQPQKQNNKQPQSDSMNKIRMIVRQNSLIEELNNYKVESQNQIVYRIQEQSSSQSINAPSIEHLIFQNQHANHKKWIKHDPINIKQFFADRAPLESMQIRSSLLQSGKKRHISNLTDNSATLNNQKQINERNSSFLNQAHANDSFEHKHNFNKPFLRKKSNLHQNLKDESPTKRLSARESKLDIQKQSLRLNNQIEDNKKQNQNLSKILNWLSMYSQKKEFNKKNTKSLSLSFQNWIRLKGLIEKQMVERDEK